MSETDLTGSIVKALNTAGHWAIRINSGTFRGAGGYVTGAPRGTGDVLLADPYGWLEVKLPGEEKRKSKTAEAQAKFRHKCQRRGVRHAVVTSVAEAVRIVGEWR